MGEAREYMIEKGLSIEDHRAQVRIAERLRLKLQHEAVTMHHPERAFHNGAGYISEVILTYLEKELGSREEWPR